MDESEIIYILGEYLTQTSDGWENSDGAISNFQYLLYKNNALDNGRIFLDLENLNRWLEINKSVDVCDKIMNLIYTQPDHFLKEIFPSALEFMSEQEENIDALFLEKKLQLIFLNPTRKFKVGVSGIRDYLKVNEISSNYINQLVVVKCTLSAISKKTTETIRSDFICTSCYEEIKNTEIKPKKCPACGGKSFIENPIVVWDTLYCMVTNSPEDGVNIPIDLKCVFRNKMVEEIMLHKSPLGANLKLIGIVRNVVKKKKPEGELILDVMGVEFLSETEEMVDVSLSESAFKEFAKRKDLYEILRKSVAPTIYGYDEVKDALVLQLFGGTQNLKVGKRGNIHILIVGDFAIGKTRLLEFYGKVAPNARYVSCISATGRGLTATVSREEGMGWVVKIGPVILAHKGFALLDELDKIDKDELVYLGDILELQRFELSKGGITANFQVETSILAAANPKYGRFDNYEEIFKNIDLPPEIMSRFDLIFALRDVVDMDEEYVKHMRELYLNGSKKDDKLVDLNFLKNYIWYARNYIFPKLTPDALEYLDKIYLKLRKKYYDTGTFHFDRRRREVLIRLAEASARARLSNKATKEDVDRAMRIMNYFLKTVAFDPELNTIDVDVLQGKPKSKRDKFLILEKLFDECVNQDKLVNMTELIQRITEELSMDEYQAELLIREKIRLGDWHEPRPGWLARV